MDVHCHGFVLLFFTFANLIADDDVVHESMLI